MCKYRGFYIYNLNLIAKYKQKILIDTKKKLLKEKKIKIYL